MSVGSPFSASSSCPDSRTAGQPDTPLRLTAVYHKDDGVWKVVQAHAPIPVRNEETAFGEVPT